MKRYLLFCLITCWFMVAVVRSSDVTPYVESFEIPFAERYRGGEEIYARNVWDLQAFEGRLYNRCLKLVSESQKYCSPIDKDLLKNNVAIYTVFDRLFIDIDFQISKLIKNMVAILTTLKKRIPWIEC